MVEWYSFTMSKKKILLRVLSMTLNALDVVMALCMCVIFLQIWKYILVFLYPLSNRCIARESKSIFFLFFRPKCYVEHKIVCDIIWTLLLEYIFALSFRGGCASVSHFYFKKMKSELIWQQFGIILTVKRSPFFYHQWSRVRSHYIFNRVTK